MILRMTAESRENQKAAITYNKELKLQSRLYLVNGDGRYDYSESRDCQAIKRNRKNSNTS